MGILWLYLFFSFIAISALGFSYAFYLKKQINKLDIVEKEKEKKDRNKKQSRRMRHAYIYKRGRVVLVSSILLIGGLLLSLVWSISQPDAPAAIEQLHANVQIEVESFESEGRDHLTPDDPMPQYVTFPPTSGPHSPAAIGFYGFYEQELPFEELVHSLEHGDIVIYYQPTVDEQVKERLKYLSQFTKIGSGVIVLPNADIEGEVVATAWTKKMTLAEFDEQQLGQFIYDHIYEGPERVAGLQPNINDRQS